MRTKDFENFVTQLSVQILLRRLAFLFVSLLCAFSLRDLHAQELTTPGYPHNVLDNVAMRKSLARAMVEAVNELADGKVSQITFSRFGTFLSLLSEEELEPWKAQVSPRANALWEKLTANAASKRPKHGEYSLDYLKTVFPAAFDSRVALLDGKLTPRQAAPGIMAAMVTLNLAERYRNGQQDWKNRNALEFFSRSGATYLRNKVGDEKLQRIVSEQFYPNPFADMLNYVDEAKNRSWTLVPRMPPTPNFRIPLLPPELGENQWAVETPKVPAPTDPELWKDEGPEEKRAVAQKQRRAVERQAQPPIAMPAQRRNLIPPVRKRVIDNIDMLDVPLVDDPVVAEVKEDPEQAVANKLAEMQRRDAARKQAEEKIRAQEREAAEALAKKQEQDKALKEALKKAEAEKKALEEKLAAVAKEAAAQKQAREVEAKNQVALTKQADSPVQAKASGPVDPNRYFARLDGVSSDQEVPKYRISVIDSIPPPFYAERTAMVKSDTRDSQVHQLIQLFGKYAELALSRHSDADLKRGLDDIQKEGSAIGVAFPPLDSRDGSTTAIPRGDITFARLPKDTAEQLYLSLAHYTRLTKAPDKTDPPLAKSEYEFRGMMGPVGAEYGVFFRARSDGRREVALFDPHYSGEFFGVASEDGTVRPLTLTLSNSFQVWLENDPFSNHWTREGLPTDRGILSMHLQGPKDKEAQTPWILTITLPGNPTPVQLPLSGDFRKRSDQGGSWGRLSSLFSPLEKDAQSFAASRSLAEQKFAESHTWIERQQKEGNRAQDFEGLKAELTQMEQLIFAQGGVRETRPIHFHLADGTSQKTLPPGGSWHYNGLVFPSGSSGGAIEVGKILATPMTFAFAPNGEYIVGSHEQPGYLTLWHAPRGAKLRKLKVRTKSSLLKQVAINATSSHMLTLDEIGAVSLWNLPTMTVVREFADTSTTRVAFSPSGASFLLVDAGGSKTFFDTWKAKPTEAFVEEAPNPGPAAEFRTSVLHNGGTTLKAVADSSGKVAYTATERTGATHAYQWIAHDKPIAHIYALPHHNGSYWCVTADGDGRMKFWRLEVLEKGIERVLLVATQELGEEILALSPNASFGYFASLSRSGVVRIHQVPYDRKGTPWTSSDN